MRRIRPGVGLRIRRGVVEWEVEVLALSALDMIELRAKDGQVVVSITNRVQTARASRGHPAGPAMREQRPVRPRARRDPPL